MIGPFRLSDTARAVLWLWQNDSKNWYIGSHAAVHEPTGVGIWTANSVYGLHLHYNIPTCDRKNAYPCNGMEVRLKWIDRKAIHRAVAGYGSFGEREIQRQISDWAADKIHNDADSYAHARILSRPQGNRK